MHQTRQQPTKNDLATRVFNNFYFDIAWIIFLALVVRVVWPLHDMWLVIWVYGRDGYFKQGIRVVSGKPTIFSNGVWAPDFPNMVTGFVVFLTTVFGLSLLLVCALRSYERYFSRKKNEGPQPN
jgi:hypothetical protein